MAGFMRRVGALGVATAAAQLMAAVNLAIIARFLPQTDVGQYSVFISYVLMLLPVALLSYEVLLPNVQERDVAFLLHGILPLAAVVATLAGLGFSAFGYPYALPLAVLLFAMAVLRLVELAGIRFRQVFVIGLARALPHFIFMSLLLGLGFAGSISLETVLWLQIGGGAIAAIVLGYMGLGKAMSCCWPDWTRTWALLCSRWRNPIVLAPSEIANMLAWNLPVVLVAHTFGETSAAQYGVMFRYVMAPVGLMNSVIGNVYHADLAHAMREQDPKMRERFYDIRKRMFFLGMAAGLATALLLPYLLRWLLGPGWEVAETLVLIMAPLISVAIWVAPFGVAFYVFERSWEFLILNLAYVGATVAIFNLGLGDLYVTVGLFVSVAILRFLVMLARVERMIVTACKA